VARRTTGRAIPVTGAWGATETAPAVTAAHFEYADARCIGVPLPGAEVKLVPAEGAYEIRVKGPNVTPGYFARPDLTAAAFDGEGFYQTGDAVAFANARDPNAGLVFRGRIAEDFKLATGTFVRVGALRSALLSCARVLSDAVITGEERPFVCALARPNAAEVRTLLGEEPQQRGELVINEALLKTLAQALADHNAGQGSAARIERLAVLAGPPDLDAGEITDKGYVNQRRVLVNRAALADLLYTDSPPPMSSLRGGALMRYENVAIPPPGRPGAHRSLGGEAPWQGAGEATGCSPVAPQAILAQPSSSASITESCCSGHRPPADRVPDLQDRLPRSADSRSTTGTKASMNSICLSGVQYLGCSTEESTTPFCTTRSRSM